MSDEEVLLSNGSGTIAARGAGVLLCDCQGDGLDIAALGVSTFALTVSLVITGIVAARAAPWPMLLISTTWSLAALAALVVVRRRRRLHGRFRLDFERGELVQEGRGFRRVVPLGAIEGVSTPFAGDSAPEDEPGLKPRWLLLHLSTGESLRLGKAPAYALGPALVFLKRAGVEASRGAPQRVRADR